MQYKAKEKMIVNEFSEKKRSKHTNAHVVAALFTLVLLSFLASLVAVLLFVFDWEAESTLCSRRLLRLFLLCVLAAAAGKTSRLRKGKRLFGSYNPLRSCSSSLLVFFFWLLL